jgi:hypothetical protein
MDGILAVAFVLFAFVNIWMTQVLVRSNERLKMSNEQLVKSLEKAEKELGGMVAKIRGEK